MTAAAAFIAPAVRTTPSRLREDIPRGIIARMNDPFPLPTLLSQALVAFTIEFDNEAERQIRHRTTQHALASPPRSLSPLFRGLEPYPDGWRASLRRPNTLPHYPMILHRGGFPDGS
jgi:hypothetical protein